MKYQKAIFTFTDDERQQIKDNALLQTSKDILCSMAGDAGFESFEENENGVTGYVQKGRLDLDALNACVAAFPIDGINISYEINDAEDKNWNEIWESEGFEPIIIKNKCVIHDTIHPIISDEKTDMFDIIIDARQAFGTGNHETTYMIVSELLDMDLTDKNVLDCGCGTGILSITAAKLGAKEITGYDIDEWSVRNTMHNCDINNVANIEVLHGDASILTNIKAGYDVILANINRNILLADMPSFRQKMKDNSILILSGFYTEDAEKLIKKAESLGLRTIKKSDRNNWCMLILR